MACVLRYLGKSRNIHTERQPHEASHDMCVLFDRRPIDFNVCHDLGTRCPKALRGGGGGSIALPWGLSREDGLHEACLNDLGNVADLGLRVSLCPPCSLRNPRSPKMASLIHMTQRQT